VLSVVADRLRRPEETAPVRTRTMRRSHVHMSPSMAYDLRRDMVSVATRSLSERAVESE